MRVKGFSGRANLRGSRTWYGRSRRSSAGRVIVSIASRFMLRCSFLVARYCATGSGAQCRNVEPFLLPPALQPELRELHAFRRFEQIPAERTLARDMPEKELPLRL